MKRAAYKDGNLARFLDKAPDEMRTMPTGKKRELLMSHRRGERLDLIRIY